MSAFTDFLEPLLRDASAVLRGPPTVDSDEAAAAKLLAAAYADHCLDLGGPPPPFDARASQTGARCVWCACWFLVHRGDEAEVVERAMTMPPPPGADATRLAGMHLSTDVTFRLLPQLHRRARGLAAADPLTGFLARLLREWPLSGVLSDVEDPPLTPVDFGGHKGLLMLYAERLAANVKAAWLPDGPAREYVELAFADRGVRLPTAPVAKPSGDA